MQVALCVIRDNDPAITRLGVHRDLLIYSSIRCLPCRQLALSSGFRELQNPMNNFKRALIFSIPYQKPSTSNP